MHIKIAAKIDIDLRVRTIGVAQRTDPIGTTVIPKVGTAFDKATGTFNTVQYVEDKKLVSTSTTVKF